MHQGVGEAPVMLADRYRQVRRIASGGMGTVYEGVDERLARRVAIKFLKEEYAEDPLFVERFGREARAAASLDHPNIAQIFDSGQDGGQHFIVMEFLEGKDLGHVLREDQRLPADVAVSVTSQVCSALAAAHMAGIVHRDIKPGNVLVRSDGRVKVTDFGIAQVKGQASLTGAGLGLGTARYLSPEQASGQEVTPASDQYSAGVLLFQMLTGNVPFTGDSPVAVALSHVREELPSVHDFAPEVPPPLAEVVATATAKDPQSRYADAAQMGAALRKALAAPHAATAAAAPDTPAATEAPDLPAVPDLPAMPDLPAAAEPLNLPAVQDLPAMQDLPAVPEPFELPAVPDLFAAQARGLRRRPAAAPHALLIAAAGLLLIGALAIGWLAISGGPSPDQAETGPALAQPRQPQVTVTVRPPRAATSSTNAPWQTISETISPRRTNPPVPSPTTSPRRAARGPVIPANAIGSDVQALQELLKSRGYEVKKVDVPSAKPKDSVVATIPSPRVPLTAGQAVVVVTSNGDAPKELSNYAVPNGILGSQASDAERLLKGSGVAVKKVDITSPRAKDTIVGTYPAPGKTAEARIVVFAVSTGG
jgi:tRNA A-37 threonylcarbamoyl transferase component Bud32